MAERRVIASTRAAQGSDVHDVVRLLGPLASEELVAGFLRRGKCVEVATLLGEVVGLAVLEWLHPLQRAGSEAWLTALVTDASARHRGVARALLGSIGRRVRQGGGGCLRIACPLEDDAQRSFLAATGFEPRWLVFERPTG